jgi:hypothetical protein
MNCHACGRLVFDVYIWDETIIGFCLCSSEREGVVKQDAPYTWGNHSDISLRGNIT